MIAVGDVLGAARILVIDDEPANVRMLHRLLTTSGCRHVTTLTDPRDVIGQMPIARPDLIILDLHMPHLDGFEVMQALRPLLSAERYLPMLIITADDAPPRSSSGRWRWGPRTSWSKPSDVTEVLLRIRNLLGDALLYRQLHDQNQRLEQGGGSGPATSPARHRDRLPAGPRRQYCDDHTGEHTHRVGRLYGALRARSACRTPRPPHRASGAAARRRQGRRLRRDPAQAVGAFASGKFAIMQTHTTMGCASWATAAPAAARAETIARTHHERWDGMGDPAGLTGRRFRWWGGSWRWWMSSTR